MKEIAKLSINALKIHPRNTEFFDDISGDEYERFKKSIKEDGILSPILIAPDMTVISGHQRLKACRDLGIELVPVMIREDLTDDDEKLKLLLAANFGRLKNDDVKQRKVAVEYVKLCGNKHGRPVKSGDNRLLTQEEIANNLGISERTLRELLEIERKLTPEVKELLNNGVFTKTTASKVLTKLSKEEQEELLSNINPDKKYTQVDIQKYIDENKKLKDKVTSLAQQSVRTETITQEVDRPETIETIKKLRAEVSEKSVNYNTLYEKMLEDNKLLNQAMGESTNWQLTSHCSEITKKMLDFVKEMAQYGYMAETFNEIPIATRNEYLRCVKAVQAWANVIVSAIEIDGNQNTNENKNYIMLEENY